jgi:arylsulfatase A-like enzyme
MKVLVVTARGLQAGALGCYGNQWVETPALDGLAAEGVVFDQHFADRADAEGARRAWRSGRYRLPVPPGQPPAAAEGGDLLEALRTHGIHTRLIVDASRPAPPDFEAGWDAVERVDAPAGEGTPLDAVLDAARAALGQLAGRDGWLLWVDLATPLPPWDVPEDFLAPYFHDEPADEEEEDEDEEEEEEAGEPLTPLGEVEPGPIDPGDDTRFLRLHSTYAAAGTYLDAGVGELLEALQHPVGGDEVLVLVSADCGQALGEHGVVGAVRPWLHDEVLHLPLIVRLPGAAEAGRRVSALTQAVDLAPTLADVFDAPLPAAHGHSLLPLVYGEAGQVRPYACAGLEVGGAIDWALRTPAWAFLLPAQAPPDGPPRGAQLYVKPDDRWEVNNVVQHHLELAEHLEQTLRDFVAATRRPGPLQAPVLRDVEAEAASPGAGQAAAGTGPDAT